MRSSILWATFGTSMALSLHGALALAATPDDAAAAEALFQEARKLVAAGAYREACPKFASSQKLDPALGTAINLADCYEHVGQTASAWAKFLEVAEAAHRAGDPKREEVARHRAAALEKRLSRLTIVVAEPARLPGLQVQRDGQPVDAAAWGLAVPVDPGMHRIEATAAGAKPWSVQIELPAGPVSKIVEVPRLEAASDDGASAAATTSAAIPDHPGHDEAAGPPGTWPARRTWALGLAGVGVVGLGLGVVSGLVAQSRWNEVKDQCDVRVGCPRAQVDTAASVGTLADLSTVGFVVAGVASVGAAVLWWTAPAPAKRSSALRWAPSIGQGMVGIALAGTYP